jgi:hypothetical protein
MVYAAPPLRASPLRLDEIADIAGFATDADAGLLAARGGLCGGEGIPELTSGTPIDPASPRSGVMESLKRRGGGVYDVAACAHIGVNVVVIPVRITTTTIMS